MYPAIWDMAVCTHSEEQVYCHRGKGVAFSEITQHKEHAADNKHMTANLRKPLVIACQSAIILHPRKRALCHPSPLYGNEIRCAEI